MKLNKAISPILATVILIAVTLVIAIGVIGWIMGIWGTFGATETIQVFPDSSISGGTLTLHIKNTGTASAVIYKIEVVGLTTLTGTVTADSSTITLSSPGLTVSPGSEVTITASITGAVAGATYQVKIYTKAGNVYSATVQAK
jgi:flagellin-like protein